MGGTFSSSSSSKKASKCPPGGSVSEIDQAVFDLKNARDRLQRYRAKLEQDEKKLLERARKYKAEGNDKAALGLLWVRRHKIKEVENVNNQLLTVMEMVDKISSKENEKEVLGAMRTGKDALKALHKAPTTALSAADNGLYAEVGGKKWDPLSLYDLENAADTFPNMFPSGQFLEEADIKHGRMAMLAWTGVWATHVGGLGMGMHFPGAPVESDWTKALGVWSSEDPGDMGFDPWGLKAKLS